MKTKNLTGRVFTRNHDWHVSSEQGTFEVVDGKSGHLHPVVYRGRDENRMVKFEIENGKANVYAFADLGLGF